MGRPMRTGEVACARCAKTLPRTAEYFPFRMKAKGYLSSWCKSCHSEHGKIESIYVRELEAQRERRQSQHVCHVCKTHDLSPGNMYCEPCAKAKVTEKKRYDKAVYKSRLRKATPKWANKFYIKEMYDLARLRTQMLGTPLHVDHVIPLRSPVVCGLHVLENLRIITGDINQKKSNHYSLAWGNSK